jgi:murein tripeptide amidase MpaA
MIADKPGILVTGAHHARELTTISMNVYLMLKLLWSWVKTEDGTLLDQEMLENEDLILKSAVITFIPVVNVDGFTYISDTFYSNGGFL